MHGRSNSNHSASLVNPDADLSLLAGLLGSLRFFYFLQNKCGFSAQAHDSLEAGHQFICAENQWEMSSCFW